MNKKNKVLSKIVQILPDAILDPVYDAIFEEFVRRGNIVFEKDLKDNNN
jgi:hypothetical protein